MKKRTSKLTESSQQERSLRPGSKPTIIFGTYRKESGRDAIVTGDGAYPITEARQNILLPLIEGAQIKALLRMGPKPSAVVLKVFGPKLTLKEHIGRVLKDAEVPLEFSKAAIKEALTFGSKPKASDKKHRIDLSNIPLATIDGESAKDFDDAVYAEKRGKNIAVVVAIADVSHYVKEGSSLDHDASTRGTSIYYPGHCVPMLPESLSNGLCSLKPKVERLAIAVTFEVGPRGRIQKPSIKEAVIKSAARLTYNQVQDFIDHKPSAKSLPDKLKDSLKLLQKAAHSLRKSREIRGAIDFDIIESVIALDDQGEPMAIHPQDRLDSHRIIEDLMVATNEVVAEVFEKKRLPGLYRVHEAPDQEKLANFFKTAHAVGALDNTVKTKPESITEPKALQEIMEHYQKSKYKEVLNNLMLRSMMQARYSEENLMHFGLASTAYLHFTSPIRRYADLIVHRQIRRALFEKDFRNKIPERRMKEIAGSISEKEIRATDIERKIDRLFAATFMAGHIGEVYDAVIVSCTEFGFFVRIVEHHVEGLVHIASISRSHVNFVPERLSLVVSGSNERYMVGDKVRVKLMNVNVDRGHVDFELVTDDKGPKKSRPKKRQRRR